MKNVKQMISYKCEAADQLCEAADQLCEAAVVVMKVKLADHLCNKSGVG